MVIEALNILRREHAFDLRCVLTGADGGNLDYVLGYAERLGVRDLIDYRPAQGRRAWRTLQRRLGAGLRQQRWTGQSAAAGGYGARLPRDRSRRARLGGAVGDAAVFGSSDRRRALATQLLRLANEAGLREELVRRGAALVDRLPPESYAAAVLDILDEFSAIARAWERCDSLASSPEVF